MSRLAQRGRRYMGAESIPTAKSYTQDGLVALWDGLENVGYGQRDTTSIIWKNLQGDNSWDMTVPASWNDLGMYFDGTWCAIAPKTALNQVTIECVFAGGSLLSVGWSYAGTGTRMSVLNNSNSSLLRGYLTGDNVFDGTFSSDIKHLALAVSNSRKTGEIYANGIVNATKTFSRSTTDTTKNRFRLGGYGSASDTNASGMFYIGTIYRCAIYNRKLSATEIAHHYAIDKQRYGI